MADRDGRLLWVTDRWNGGTSEDSRGGVAGAHREGSSGLNVRADSGVLEPSLAPTGIAGTSILTSPITWMTSGYLGNNRYGMNRDGIYRWANDGSGFTKRHSFTLAGFWANSTKGQGGMLLSQGTRYLYYTSCWGKIGRADLSIDDGAHTEAQIFDDDWGNSLTGAATNPNAQSWTPLVQFGSLICIGNGRGVHTIDDVGTWTTNAVPLPANYAIRHLFLIGKNLAILAVPQYQAINDTETGMLFLWDGAEFGTGPVDYYPLTGSPHAGVSVNNRMYIIGGNELYLQESLGAQTQTLQRVPGIEPGRYAEVWPSAIDVSGNLVHFGISDGNSENVSRMVYTYGAKNVLMPMVLNAEYPISPKVGAISRASTIQVTGVKRLGPDLWVAWKNGSDYGIDRISYGVYIQTAVYRSPAFDRQSPHPKKPDRIKVELAGALQAGESIEFRLSKDPYGDRDFTDGSVFFKAAAYDANVPVTQLEIPFSVETGVWRSADLHFELRLKTGGTTAPRVKRVWIQMTEDNDQL